MGVYNKARTFLVDLWEKSDLGLWGRIKKKSSENDQLTGHFQSFFLFFFIFRAFFFNISRKNSKTSKVNQQYWSVLNL